MSETDTDVRSIIVERDMPHLPEFGRGFSKASNASPERSDHRLTGKTDALFPAP